MGVVLSVQSQTEQHALLIMCGCSLDDTHAHHLTLMLYCKLQEGVRTDTLPRLHTYHHAAALLKQAASRGTQMEGQQAEGASSVASVLRPVIPELKEGEELWTVLEVCACGHTEV